jgi:hypothetical protein
LRRCRVELKTQLGRLLWHWQRNPDGTAAALCYELDKCWPALQSFPSVAGVAPTNNVAERVLR